MRLHSKCESILVSRGSGPRQGGRDPKRYFHKRGRLREGWLRPRKSDAGIGSREGGW